MSIHDNDIELLQLAAQAAGYKLMPWDNAIGFVIRDSAGHPQKWNALLDDGDCFRMVIACDIDIEFDPTEQRTIATHSDGERCQQYWDGLVTGKATATRRAAVRAAAEIQKAKR
jgi:hypothetical protein